MLICLYKIVKEYFNGKKWYYYVIPLVFFAFIWVTTLQGISNEMVSPVEDPTGSFSELGGVLLICELLGAIAWCRVIYGTFFKK